MAEPGPTATAPRPGRLQSIDALRGFDMFWIVGGDALGRAFARWLGGPAGRVIDEQLEHVPWEGFRFYDLIFPLFLFLVGVVIPFSLGGLKDRGASDAAVYRRVARRTAALFALGLIYNDVLQFDVASLRVTGVLQRIAVCYGCASLIALHTKPRGQAAVVVAVLLGYWAVLALVPAPGSAPGDYTKEGNLAGYVDRHYLPGKIYPEYYGYGDNEGILSTPASVATTLMGVLAGQWLRAGRSPAVTLAGLALAGVLGILAGNFWDRWLPVIKILWTGSYVLVAGGWSLLLLALFYGLIDVFGIRRWAFVFVVIGVNAITVYVLNQIVDFARIADFFVGGVARLTGSFGPVIRAAGVLVVEWLVLFYLYRNRHFLRV